MVTDNWVKIGWFMETFWLQICFPTINCQTLWIILIWWIKEMPKSTDLIQYKTFEWYHLHHLLYLLCLLVLILLINHAELKCICYFIFIQCMVFFLYWLFIKSLYINVDGTIWVKLRSLDTFNSKVTVHFAKLMVIAQCQL